MWIITLCFLILVLPTCMLLVRYYSHEHYGGHPMLRDDQFEHHCRCWNKGGGHVCPAIVGHYGDVPPHWQWYRIPASYTIPVDTLCYFTDSTIEAGLKHPKSILWLVEPRVIAGPAYRKALETLTHWVAIWTHDKDFIDICHDDDRVQYIPNAMTWIPKPQRMLYPKREQVSFIASAKTGLEAYDLRHRVLPLLDQAHCYGTITGSYLKDRVLAFAPYRFTVVIENSIQAGYFSEKLIDALLCGTIPLYRGDPCIADHFDTSGFLLWTTEKELEAYLEQLSPQLYESCLPAIIRNFNLAKQYTTAEWFMIKLRGEHNKPDAQDTTN